jgi:hypothetical protein
MSARLQRRTSAVLIVRSDSVEWFEPGGASERHAHWPAPTASGPELAKAALAARRKAGGRARRCRVALAGDLVTERLISLPDVARGELQGVLERKAALALQRDPADVAFAARRAHAGQRGSSEGGGAGGSTWLVCAAGRALVRDLRLALAREGIGVSEVVSLRLARQSHLAAARSQSHPCALTLDVDRSGVCVALWDGADLRHWSVLNGDLEHSAALATNLMQELRSVEAWWRKQSRGGGLTSVACVGLSDQRAQVFEHALAAAIPGAEVHCERGPKQSDGTQDALDAPALRAALGRGPFALSVAVPIPVQHSRAMLVTLSVLALVAITGLVVQSEAKRAGQRVTQEAEDMLAASRDLERLRSFNQRCETLSKALRSEIERVEAMGTQGRELALAVEACLRAVENDGEIVRLDLAPSGELICELRLGADPLGSIRTLDRVRERLERAPHLTGVRVSAPVLQQELGPKSAQQAVLLVRIDGRWSPGPAGAAGPTAPGPQGTGS